MPCGMDEYRICKRQYCGVTEYCADKKVRILFWERWQSLRYYFFIPWLGYGPGDKWLGTKKEAEELILADQLQEGRRKSKPVCDGEY